MPGWKERATTKYTGERVQIASMDGDYWIVPQKLGMEAMERIYALQEKVDAVRRARYKEAGVSGVTAERVLKRFKDELPEDSTREQRERILREEGITELQCDVVLAAAQLFTVEAVDMMRIGLAGGVHDHNFDDEAGKPLAWGKELVEELLAYPEVAGEIFGAVMEYNRPLASGKSRKSGTRRSGSTAGSASERSARTTRTAATPPKS